MEKRIEIHKTFLKHYRKRIQPHKKLKKKYLERYDMFCHDRGNPILGDHGLQGSMNGARAFKVTGDYRVVYQEFENHYLFLDIGTHNQVY